MKSVITLIEWLFILVIFILSIGCVSIHSSALGEYNNIKNAPSELHYGLHGDGNVLKKYSATHTIY